MASTNPTDLSARPARRRPLWSRIRAVLIPLALSLALVASVEVALRVFGFKFNPYTHYRSQWGPFEESNNRSDYLPDAELFWRLMPSHTITGFFAPGAHINRHGFRGPEVDVAKPDGVVRIVALGDSGTFGWQVSDQACYPRQLEHVLNARPGGPRVEVINAGVPGYTSYQGLGWYRRHVARFRPDVVIISFGGNDGDKLPVADAERGLTPDQILRQRRLLRTRLYQFVYFMASKWKYSRPDEVQAHWAPRVDLPSFRRNTAALVHAVRSAGGTPLLMARLGGPNEAGYAAALASIAAKEDLPYLADGIRGHPPAAVYREIAHRVADMIVEARKESRQ